MKHFCNIAGAFALVMFLSTAALAQSADAGSQAPVDNSCFKLVGDADFSFGTLDQNETVEHVFEFENNCDRIIHVDKVSASCGCTAAILSEKDIKPGERAKVNVKFTPPQRSVGKVTKTVSVFVQGDNRVHTTIRFSADIKTDIVLNPQYINLRGAEVGKQVREVALLKNMTNEPMTITDPQITLQSYADTTSGGAGVPGSSMTVAIPLENATITPKTFTVGPGQEQELVITFTPEYRGNISGSVRFKSGKSETWLQVHGVAREASSGDVRH